MKQLQVISHNTYAQGLTAGTSTLADVGSLALGAFALLIKILKALLIMCV